MEAIYHAFQHWMLCACLAGLGIMAALVFLAKVAAPAWDALRHWWSLPCIQRVIVAVCVVGLSYYGATKQGWHVGYDGGIKAGATANVVTNDTVSIHWQRDTSGGVYVPESAAVYIDYRPNTETNAEWGLLAQTTVGAWGWSGTVENATNYDYNVWAYYIPPEPVHTNGVWTYKTHFDRSGEYALPLRARVEVNGVAIATPAEKRKDTTLPYDAEVEYLESSGTQRIEIGMTFDARCVLDMTFQFTRFVNNATCHGQTAATAISARLAFGKGAASWNDWYCGIGDKNYRTGKALDLAVHRFVVDAPGDKFVIDDTTYNVGWTSFDLPSNPNSATLYNRARVNSSELDSSGIYGKLYCCKIWQDGLLVRDYIPVRVGTVGAMYDRRGVGGMNPDGSPRNDGMYFNRGTGNFGYGNDK